MFFIWLLTENHNSIELQENRKFSWAINFSKQLRAQERTELIRLGARDHNIFFLSWERKPALHDFIKLNLEGCRLEKHNTRIMPLPAPRTHAKWAHTADLLRLLFALAARWQHHDCHAYLNKRAGRLWRSLQISESASWMELLLRPE